MNKNNEKTIIHGVNVKECQFYSETMHPTKNCSMLGDEHLYSCNAGNNCYYKNWKYKEQECEELKEKLDYFEKCNKDLDNYIPAFRMGEFGYIKKSEVLTDELEQLKAENKKLKQTLAEIKDIVQFGFRPYKVCGEHNNCCDVLNEIWNKISKCEVKNED
jgi:hypothetical protein